MTTTRTISAERIRIAMSRASSILQGTDRARNDSKAYTTAVAAFRTAVAAIPEGAPEADRVTALERALRTFDAAIEKNKP